MRGVVEEAREAKMRGRRCNDGFFVATGAKLNKGTGKP